MLQRSIVAEMEIKKKERHHFLVCELVCMNDQQSNSIEKQIMYDKCIIMATKKHLA